MLILVAQRHLGGGWGLPVGLERKPVGILTVSGSLDFP